MNKTIKLLLGLLTVWPFAYLILFFVVILSMIFFAGAEPGAGPPPAIALIFPLHILTMLVSLALTVFYMVNVFRNDRVEKDKKVLWAVVLFLGNAIAMPIYWYLYIWKEAQPAIAYAPAQLGSANTSMWTNEARAERPAEEYVPPAQPPNWRD